jgi:hypothetical protein
MNLRRLVISAALLAAVGAFMSHLPSDAPEAVASAAVQLERSPAPSR